MNFILNKSKAEDGAADSSSELLDGIELQAFEQFAPWVVNALPTCSALPPHVVSRTIQAADYGCSEGKTSLVSFSALKEALEEVGALGKEGGASHLKFALNDLPTNNWNAVASNFCAPHALGTEPTVLLSMVPRSFYSGPLLPDASFHFGICNNALLWRSASPYASAPDHVVYFGQGEQVENAFKQKAMDDLNGFLRFRAAEIMPGGLLLIITPGTLGSQCSYASLYDAFAAAGRELVEEERMDRYLFQEFVMPVYFFTAQELEAAAHQTGDWAVLQRGAASLPSLYETYYKEQGDAEQYARMLVQLFRSFAEKRTRSALGLNDTTAEEFFTRAEKLVAAAPTQYAFRNVHAAVLLERRPVRPLHDRRTSTDSPHPSPHTSQTLPAFSPRHTFDAE